MLEVLSLAALSSAWKRRALARRNGGRHQAPYRSRCLTRPKLARDKLASVLAMTLTCSAEVRRAQPSAWQLTRIQL